MRSILIILLLLILLSTAILEVSSSLYAQTTPIVRPKTGTFFKDTYRNGHGELTIKNELNNEDAVCIVSSISNPEIPLIAVYIRAGESFTIKNIKDGKYYLYFSLGRDWNNEQYKFTKNVRFERFKDIFEFETQYVGNSIYYTVYEVTLYGVVGGKAESVNVSERDFPTLK